MRYIDESLEELKEKNVLLNYEKTRITGKRNKIEDVIYVLTPQGEFINQVKKANARENHLREVYVLLQGRK